MIILQGLTVAELIEQLSTMMDKKWEEREKALRKEALRYLSRQEVADLLKISLPTLHEWTKAGMLPSYRIGNRVLYKESEIDLTITQKRGRRFTPFSR